MKDKLKSVFISQSCGTRSPKWLGRCPGCGEWNTMVEEAEETGPAAEYSFPPSEALLYRDIKEFAKQRIRVPADEFNKVLGGGVVLGSLVLIGGEPWIGKSTLLLLVCRDFDVQGERVLYVSGEEALIAPNCRKNILFRC